MRAFLFDMDGVLVDVSRSYRAAIQNVIEFFLGIVPKLRNFGTLFIGEWAPEVLGDYCCGINHILPTSGAASYTGGLNVRDFLKIQTTLKVNKKGFERMAPIAASFARAEGLTGHALSIGVRKSSIKGLKQ